MNLSNSALMGLKTEISATDGKSTGSGKKAGPALPAGSEKHAENFRRALAHASNRGQTHQASRQTTAHQTHPSAQEGKQKNNAQPTAAETSGRSKADAKLEAESAKALLSWLDDLKEQSGESPVAAELQQLVRLINGGEQAAEASLGLPGGKSTAGPAAGITTGGNRPAGDSALLAKLQQLLSAEPSAGKAAGEAADLTSSRTEPTEAANGKALQDVLDHLRQLLLKDTTQSNRSPETTKTAAGAEFTSSRAPLDAGNGKALQDMLDHLRQLLKKDGAQNSHSQETTKTAAETDQELTEQLRKIFESREKASVQARQAGAADAEKAAGRDLQAQLKQLFEQAETGKARAGQGKDAQAAASDAEKAAGGDLQARLKQLFQQTEAGDAARGGQGKDTQAAASLANATEGRRTPETEGRSTLRQLLNDLADKTAAEEKGAGSGKAKEALAELKAGLKNTDAGKGDLEQLLRGLNAEKTGAKPSALTEAGSKTADLAGQTQAGSQSNEKAAAPSAPARQTGAPSFDRALQNAENRVVSQVFVRLFSGARQGSGNMTINMHPPELGSVKVRITSESGHLNVSLHPQNHQVVGILERHLPTLQQSLADQGLDISDLQVSVDSGGEEGKSRFEEQVFDGRQHRASKAETADAEAEALAETSQADGMNSESGLSLRV